MIWDLDNIRPDKEISRNEMRKIFESPNLIQVRLVASFLQNEDIHVNLTNQHQAGNPGVPHWAIPVNAKLWVLNPAQYDQATAALAKYWDKQSQEASEEWTCAKCREINPGNFLHCWQCGLDVESMGPSS